jgi:molybdate transport system substrate-binding protein
MKRRAAVGMAAAFLFLFARASAAADIRVYSGGAPQEVLQILAPEFERQAGHRVSFTFALVTEIERKLAAGERADVLLLPIQLLSALEKTIPMRPEGRSVLARTGIGLIVRTGSKPPDISTAEAVRKTLLSAYSIALPAVSVPSGRHLTRVFKDLGIADAIEPKLLFKPAIEGGAGLVANGQADVGLYLVSEVRKVKEVTVIGLLPHPFQNFIVYGAAVPVHSFEPDAGLAFIRFISDATHRDRWQATGFELDGTR